MDALAWGHVRKTWERDKRDGYSWLVDQLALNVSGPAIRKRALSDGWKKGENLEDTSGGAPRKKRLSVARDPLAPPDPTKRKTLEDVAPDLAAKLTTKALMFVGEHQKDGNRAAAAIRAGYKNGKSVRMTPAIKEAVTLLRAELLDRMSAEADAIVTQLYALATADPGEITQYRRTCCRHCWGTDFGYQRTPAEYKKHVQNHAIAVAKASKAKMPAPEFDEGGGFDYNPTKDPNPECPECFGEGEGRLYIADTRTLSPGARLLFESVEQTKEGLKINLRSRDKAIEMLGRIMGLFKDAESGDAPKEVNVEELERRYADRMATARARQRAVLEERGLLIEGEQTGKSE